ncbi:hypothetical protein J2Y66_002734 [Paenarthrobacter nitroguajacolicus]|nr:hypothetical protein [Paenarthrobacter nitroguajacolicus]
MDRESPGMWASVVIGAQVTMTKRGHNPFRGTVDDRTADGTILWIRSRTGIRKLFHTGDGFQLTPGGR